MPVAHGSTVEAPQPDLSAARRRAERIRMLTLSVTENMTKLRDLVREAKASADHLALGYPSWTAYLADLFGDEPLRLARDVRRELVAELAAQGMSTRAIAPIVGVDQTTVARDIAREADASPEVLVLAETPALEEPPLVGYDPATGELIDDTPRVVGLDGKSYPKREPPRVIPPKSSDVEKIVAQIEQATLAATGASLLIFEAPDADRAAEWARRVGVSMAALRIFADSIARWHR